MTHLEGELADVKQEEKNLRKEEQVIKDIEHKESLAHRSGRAYGAYRAERTRQEQENEEKELKKLNEKIQKEQRKANKRFVKDLGKQTLKEQKERHKSTRGSTFLKYASGGHYGSVGNREQTAPTKFAQNGQRKSKKKRTPQQKQKDAMRRSIMNIHDPALRKRLLAQLNSL